MSPRTLHSLVLASSAVAVPVLAADPLITSEDVQKSLRENAPAWERSMESRSPRLFFSDAEWPQVVEQINAMPAPRAAFTTQFFEEMDKVVAEPLPAYQTPEQMVGKRHDSKTLYGAMEELWQRQIGNKIFGLSVAARLKPDGPYEAKLHDLVLAAIGFETWGRAKPPMGNNTDLSAGHLLRGIATAYDWHRDIFTEAERAKIRETIAERGACMLGALYGNAYWARGYLENHNHVAIAGLAFAGVAFHDEIPEAPEWLAAAHLNFQHVGRVMPADGSSVEGTSYWGYGMAFILQYIEATRAIIGSDALYETPFLRNAASYRQMAATPGLAGVLPWGDSVVRGWSTPQYVLYRFATQYGDPGAAWFADHLPPPTGGYDELTLNMLWARTAPAGGTGPSALDGRLWVNDMVNSRTGWAADDYLLSIKAGHTNRNHSHLDAGALALAFGEEWLLATPGYGTGAGSGDFWDRSQKRWTFFSNATESHSTLLINGRNQSYDWNAHSTVTQFFSAPQWTWASLDLTDVYEDATQVKREVLHRRGEYIIVFDRVDTPQSAKVEWLAQFRMEPRTEEDGSLFVEGGNGSLRILMFNRAGTFARRQPTAPTVDVKPPYFTYAVTNSGTHTTFLALLQPVKAADQIPSLQAKASPGTITIAGQGWVDHLAYGATSLSIPLAGADKVTAKAALAVARVKNTSVDSLLALEATELRAPGFAFSSPTACDLAVETSDANTWLVTASRDITAEITTTGGRSFGVVVKGDAMQAK